MFGSRKSERPRAAVRTAATRVDAAAPVFAECLEQRLLLTGDVNVWVETIQSTGEHPGSPAGTFRFHAFACGGTNPPASVTVGFSLSGTATQGDGCGGSGDYTGEITSGTVTIPVVANQDQYTDLSFDAVNDQEVEDIETVIVTLDDSGTYAIAEIIDDDVNVWVEATDPEAKEDAQDPATFTIHREGGGGDLAVYYTLGGSATPGILDDEDGTITPDDADYIAGIPETAGNYFKVVIPSGHNTVNVTVAPLNDPLVEGDETIELSLAADQSPGGPFYNAPGQAGPMMAAANLIDLLAGPARDPNAPSAADIQAQIDLYETGTEQEKETAEITLRTWFDQHPSIERKLEDALAAAGDASIPMLQSILGPLKLEFTAKNTITASTRFVPSGVAFMSVEFPGQNAFAKFENPGTKTPIFNLQGSGDSKGVEVTPLRFTQRQLITISMTFFDSVGNEIGTASRTFDFSAEPLFVA